MKTHYEHVCQICSIKFIPGPGSKGKACSKTCGLKLATLERAKRTEQIMYERETSFAKQCNQCSGPIIYAKRHNKFCSSSCAATYNNLHSLPDRKHGPKAVPKPIKEPKPVLPKKIKHIKKKRVIDITAWHKNITGQYSQLFKCECKHCGVITMARYKRAYCPAHIQLYKSSRTIYLFSFNIYKFPDLFDISLIQKYGWYSPGNRGPANPNGMSRDHKISVSAAIKNNYNAYYITHPINCELMRHSENKTKYTKSSLSYDELVTMVDLYDMATSVGFEPTALF